MHNHIILLLKLSVNIRLFKYILKRSQYFKLRKTWLNNVT
jgi:hypothetical protein